MTRSSDARIAVIGGGLGGAAAAILLHQAGQDVTVYEQAPAFTRLGAGIQLSPNVTRVLRALGIEEHLRATGLRPTRWLSRKWDTGEILLELELGDALETRYGAPYFSVHRGDFHASMIDRIPATCLQFGKQLVGLAADGEGMRLEFADGTHANAEIVIGADGLNSIVREILLGPERPIYSGHVAHRAVFPAATLGGVELADYTKWWSDDRHFIIYYMTAQRDEIYFVTGYPDPDWPGDTQFLPCTREELANTFEGFHPEVQVLIGLCPEVNKWPLFDRAPLPKWSEGRVVLLGDACHPMKPHMGQGAAMAIEDAAMLVRCLEVCGTNDLEKTFRLYAANRTDRTQRVQFESRAGTWLRDSADVDWVFGYDVFTEPLVGTP